MLRPPNAKAAYLANGLGDGGEVGAASNLLLFPEAAHTQHRLLAPHMQQRYEVTHTLLNAAMSAFSVAGCITCALDRSSQTQAQHNRQNEGCCL